MTNTKRVLLTLLVMLFWGSLFPVVKLGFVAYQIVSIGDLLLFAGIRFTLCGAIILLFTLFSQKNALQNTKSAFPLILLFGLFAVVLHYAFTYIGLRYADSSQTALMKKVGVLIYIALSSFFLREDKITWQKLLGALCGLAGMVAMNTSQGAFSFGMGDFLIILASFCTVASNLVGKKLFLRVQPLCATGISQFFCGMILLIAGKLMGGQAHFAWNADLLILGYICIASVLGYCLWFWLLKDGELSKMFIIQFAEPAFAAIFGFLLLREDIWNVQILLAFFLVLCGVVVSNLSKKAGST